MTEWIRLPKPYAAFSMPDDTDLAGPGVYRWSRSTGESYVGKASSILSRLGDHRRAGMLTVIEEGEIFPTGTAEAADQLERTLIWLLDPSENIQRPVPSFPLWAATLGRARPVDGWSWYRPCGHVLIGDRCLADPLDVMRSDCSCEPWLGWFDTARSAAEAMQAQIAALTERAEAVLTERATESVDPEDLAWANARIEALEEEVRYFERLRERADWTP